MARRYQRFRRKGTKLPAGVVCVTRPGPFGNPFKVPPYSSWSPARAVSLFRECLERAVRGQPLPANSLTGGALTDTEMRHFEEMAARLHELWGKDVACFCALNAACHADVLLEIANR